MALLAKKPKALDRMLNKKERQRWKSSKGIAYPRKRRPLTVAQVKKILIKSGALLNEKDVNAKSRLVGASYVNENFLIDLRKVPRNLLRLLKYGPVRRVSE